MKRYFTILVLLAFCTSSSYSQDLLSDNIIKSEGITKDGLILWTKTNLTYYFDNYASHGLTSSQCVTAIQSAFSIWSHYSNFTFTRTYNKSQADIEIQWLKDPIFEKNDTSLAYSWIGIFNGRTPPTFIFLMTTKPSQ